MTFKNKLIATLTAILASIIFISNVATSQPVKAEPKRYEVMEEETKDQNANELHKVTKVVDGDTLKIDIDGVETTIRLIGIDTPETVHPNKPVECLGIEASNKLKELIGEKEVRLELDASQGEVDTYGRTLGYIFYGEININQLMIAEGFAYEYMYDEAYRYQEHFKQAEEKARGEGRGLWEDGVCEN